jgi:hypothetical protein
MTHAQARQILAQAWRRVWGRAPTARELTYAAAIANLETGYGRAGQFGQLAARGQYNWGALERRPDASGQCPPGTALGSDQGSVCFYVFPDDVSAATAFVTTLTKKHWPVIAAMRGTPLDVARAMRVPPAYYTGTAGTSEERAKAYARAITNAIRAAGQPVPSGEVGDSTLVWAAAIGLGTYAAYRYLDKHPDAIRRLKWKLA